MAIPLKYNTASQEIPLGHFLDSTDGNTEETGLTIANTDIKLWKSGATTLANKNSGGATHISNGIYYATLDATDTNTYGPLVVFVHVAGGLAVKVECVVMEANAYDALYAALGTGYVEADARLISGDATAANNCESFFDGTGYAGTNNVIPTVTTLTGHTAQTGDSFARIGANGSGLSNIDLPNQTMDITGDITGNLSGSVGSVTGAVGSVTGAVGSVTGHTNQTGDTFALANGATGFVAIDTVVDAIKVVTDAITTNGSGLSAMPWNAAWDAEVQSEVNDALVAFFTSSAQLVDDILDETGSVALVGNPTSLRELIYFAVQTARNKLKYDKALDDMILFEDDNIAKKWTNAMTDDATEATRNKGA